MYLSTLQIRQIQDLPRTEQSVGVELSTRVSSSVARSMKMCTHFSLAIRVLKHTGTSIDILEAFITPYTKPAAPKPEPESDDAVDLDNPPPSSGAQLPCPQAVELLADMFVERLSQDPASDSALAQAHKLYQSLADELDPMRKKYVQLVHK